MALFLRAGPRLAVWTLLSLVAQLGCANGQVHSYLIAAGEGYGVQECLVNDGDECGKSLADAWCESHNQGVAISFGPAGDLADPTPKRANPDGTFRITCSE